MAQRPVPTRADNIAVPTSGQAIAHRVQQAAKPNWIDRTLEAVAPVYAQRRLAARIRSAFTRAYLAAAPGDSWRPRRANASANADHAYDAATLRAKSRFLIQNVEYITAGMNARTALLVGTGIVPKWGGPLGPQLQALWQQWAPQADADGNLDYYGLQAMAAAAMEADGEVLIRLRPRRPQDNLAVPLQLQVLEVDWLDNIRLVADNGNQIIEGKEYNALGQCVAYWLWDAHPGDIGLRKAVGVQSRRVPAESIIHLYAPKRPGQGRGFPRLAPVITRARDLQLLEDAELQRKNLESRLSVLASQDVTALQNAPDGAALPTGSLGELAGGGITNVGAGMNLTTVQPHVAPGFVDYCYYNIHLICAGAGFTFEQATGRLAEVNFSSARIGQLNQRREIEQLQWHCLVPMLCQRICLAFASTAALAGKLGPIAQAKGVQIGVDFTLEHSTPKWEYTNPVDEVKADLDEIGGGLTSFSEKMRRRGDDPAVRTQELADDITRFKSLGIWDDMVQLMTGSRPAAAPAAIPGKPAAKPGAQA